MNQSDIKATVFAIALAMHVVAAIALVLLFFQTRGMTVLCIGAAALIGCGAVPARPGRPVTLYITFGMLMGYAFWLAISAISQREFLGMVIVLLLVIGALWLLQDPRWPATVYCGVVFLLCLGMAGWQYRNRHDLEYEPELVRKSALTSLVILGVAVVYLVLGFTEAALQEPLKAKRVTRRKKRQPG